MQSQPGSRSAVVRTIVVGAGPAGLAVAATLQSRGVPVSLVERGAGVGANWRGRYDGLRLNTVRWLSHLPGRRIPSRMGRWVGRDDFVEYLERYAEHHRLRPEFGVTVRRIDRDPDRATGWLLSTDSGDRGATAVVVTTGAFDTPVTPVWPGIARFRGELCHASDYRSPAPYAGRTVLVVGAGASGLEIATLLADGGAGEVYLSVRSCQNLYTRQWHGLPLTPAPIAQRLPTGILDVAGASIRRLLGADWPSPLPRAQAGLGTALRRDGHEPVVADGIVAALRSGRVRLVPGVTDLSERDVILDDGQILRPDAVIMATGYGNGLGRLVGHLGVLGPGGLPSAPGGQWNAAAPGLAFVAFEPTVTGRLLRIPGQAREAAATVQRALAVSDGVRGTAGVSRPPAR
ncbi:MAG TPA: NAD(P)/FAD-dependent oxidoreductase [Micromonosporaceae bacterium]|nr:NAD(P)/FAD-dependent oxidoreductase [Micromonosporaceae bacterium]